LTSYDYSSRYVTPYDRVVVTRPATGNLAGAYYVGIYTNTISTFKLSVKGGYSPYQDAKLGQATPIFDLTPKYVYMTSEYEQDFYSYRPWWPGSEPREMLFLAQMVFNKIYFYLEHNQYPQQYLTNHTDVDDMIIVDEASPVFSRTGAYFIRCRPDFALYDLISERQYIYNFYAISQPTAEFIDLQSNNLTGGFANNTHVFYRHYITGREATITVTVTPIVGNPDVYVTLNNEESMPRSDDSQSYQFWSANSGLDTEFVEMTYA